MIAIHQDKVKVVQNNFSTEIEDQRAKAFNKLKSINKNCFNSDEKTYLTNVLNLFEKNSTVKIIISDPDELSRQMILLGEIPPNSRKKGRKSLKNFILDSLSYKTLRSSFYPLYFKEIGIKSCVYCNSQLTISANKKIINQYSAKFDVDHYNSKDKFPFISISLFNLYPACSSCNRAKSYNKVEFDLYTNDSIKTIRSDYKFILSPYSKAKYLTSKDSKTIDFTFKEPPYTAPSVKLFNEVFHIEGIYKTQNDLIEELIIKSQIYNQAYLKTLKSNFSKLSLHPELFKRTLVGNYTEDRDLHKRPMSKLMMDIAKDLGLI